ncbi:DUF3891 family protein [Bacillus sp. RAR_GA_16]|uniref:DUF3891 family protein n=1 Tax=Bacillus sp. RAR_GA_16 TaxID=2876774 RepID=UPI001CCE1A6B|nr:DUF3891 family protein [Bacillus sp. RAR_GA_16]MCA0172383.1 DUF3891 family protein [Bacillus sp. RAR_GA_16]
MIVYEENGCFVMTTQHDHALLSGDFASALHEDYWPDSPYREDVIHAIRHHDCGWIPLDDVPFWNDRLQTPYSFLDFPLAPKLTFYKKGIDEVSKETPYGGFLCSKHYQSFFDGATSDLAKTFYQEETLRQNQLSQRFDVSESLLTFHYQWLQFCDDLSLYACFQEPGVSKDEEISWFKQGFPQSFYFQTQENPILTHWQSEKIISLSYPLFNEEQTFQVRLKRVPKELVLSEGIAKAYQTTPFELRSFSFRHS